MLISLQASKIVCSKLTIMHTVGFFTSQISVLFVNRSKWLAGNGRSPRHVMISEVVDWLRMRTVQLLIAVIFGRRLKNRAAVILESTLGDPYVHRSIPHKKKDLPPLH